ncbi:secretin and TonB N-terminal domain-containing protein [Candidatus Omnitrophota bacterium]
MTNSNIRQKNKIRIISFFIISCLYFGAFLDSSFAYDNFDYDEYSKHISMDFKDASLKDVLKIFSQQSGMNFIASDAIKDRTVTIYLDNVPVEKALESILSANNLSYEIKKGEKIFIVRELGRTDEKTITKIFYLKYATTTISRLNRQIAEGLTDQDEGYELTVIPSGIKEAVEEILSPVGRLVEDPRTSSLIITDVASRFPIIESTIASLDIPTPQVLIEVEMLDASRNLVDKLGVKLGEEPFSWSGPTHTSFWPFDESSAERNALDSEDPISSYTVGTLDLTGFTAVLNILKRDSTTRYLARPRLLTLSNETAEIKITTDEAIGLKTTTQSSEGTAQQTQEAERAETGVSLRVTPQVNHATGEITMFIEPTVSEARTGGTFGGTTFKDPEERGTKSVVRVKNGQTVVIGGLLRTQLSQAITKVPFLGDVPLMGAMFRHKDKTQDDDRELIVFITPHIMDESIAAAAGKKALAYSPFWGREQECSLERVRAVNNALDKVSISGR